MAAGISSGAAKLGRDEDVTTTILSIVYKAFNCDIGDLVEM